MLSHQFAQTLSDQVATQGGFSADPRTGTAPSKGYMVSEHGAEKVVPGAPSAQDIVDFSGQHADKLAQPGAHIGGWLEEGETYLDVSHNVPTAADAQAMGREHAQRAVYSTKTGGAPKVKHAESIGRASTIFSGVSPEEHKELNRANQEYARVTTERRLNVTQFNQANEVQPSPSPYVQPHL